jgi:catechol 2,3-dioxygenase-like lactoylglutathione lyase family enzyme
MENTMSSTQMTLEQATTTPTPATVDLKLEVVVIPVSDVDRAKRFYEGLGWRLDGDFASGENWRGVQMTPPGSPCSIHFGTGITTAAPGSVKNLYLVVSDMEAARGELIGRGVDVSEAFHFTRFGGPPVPGPHPKGDSYGTFATFSDPDGNSWLLQEIGARLPGREWKATQTRALEVAPLAELLRETEEHHGRFEQTHAKHAWSDWYAPYLSARQQGSSPEEAVAAADRYMEEVNHVLPR